MGRGKGKLKQKQKTQTIIIEELEIENKVEIDYDKLAAAIVKAKKIEKENEEQEKAAALTKWRAEVGYNEHKNKKGLSKKFFCACNSIKVVWNIMFISKKKHIAASPTSAFIQELTSSFFVLIKWLLTAFAICFLIAFAYHPNIQYGVGEYFMCGSFALLSFMLSRVFRLMAIEIEQMSNREQVLGVFTAVVSVIPLIEKIVELFKGAG